MRTYIEVLSIQLLQVSSPGRRRHAARLQGKVGQCQSDTVSIYGHVGRACVLPCIPRRAIDSFAGGLRRWWRGYLQGGRLRESRGPWWRSGLLGGRGVWGHVGGMVAS